MYRQQEGKNIPTADPMPATKRAENTSHSDRMRYKTLPKICEGMLQNLTSSATPEHTVTFCEITNRIRTRKYLKKIGEHNQSFCPDAAIVDETKKRREQERTHVKAGQA